MLRILCEYLENTHIGMLTAIASVDKNRTSKVTGRYSG